MNRPEGIDSITRVVNRSAEADDMKLSKEKVVSLRRRYSGLYTYSASKCKICKTTFIGNNPSETCLSHSIPQFALKTLGNKLKDINAFIQNPLDSDETGLKRAGTFRLICPKCDNTKFAEYEDPNIYDDSFCKSSKLQIILNEIVMKNSLYSLYIHLLDYKYYKDELSKIPSEAAIKLLTDPLLSSSLLDKRKMAEERFTVEQADVKDCKQEFKQTLSLRKKLLNKIPLESWNLSYFHIFDRQFPIAAQAKVALSTDCWGNKICDTTKLNAEIKCLHICIFPFKEKTAVLVISKMDDNVEETINCLKSISDDEVAKALIALIMNGSRDFYFDQKTPQEIFNNAYLRALAGNEDESLCYISSDHPIEDEVAKEIVQESALQSTPLLLADYQRIPDYVIGK